MLILNLTVTCLLFAVLSFSNKGSGIQHCHAAIQCGKCVNKMQECHYYNDDMTISNDTIKCECEADDEK